MCVGKWGWGRGQLYKIPLHSLWVSPVCCSVTGKNWLTALHPHRGASPGLLQLRVTLASQGSGSAAFRREPERICSGWTRSQTRVHQPIWQGGIQAEPWMDGGGLCVVRQLRRLKADVGDGFSSVVEMVVVFSLTLVFCVGGFSTDWHWVRWCPWGV